MPKVLSEEQVAGYHENGFVTPVPLFNADEVAACRAEVENTEATMGEVFSRPWSDQILSAFSLGV